MQELLSTTALIVAVFITMLAGPAIAVAALVWRKRRARKRRRSPIGIAMLRAPGHSLRAQIDETLENVTENIVALMLVPLMLLAIFFAQSQIRTYASLVVFGVMTLSAALVVMAWQTRKLLKASDRLDTLRTGYDAELAVGQELDQLMRQGAAVFHDFPAEHFNIDHVVISRRGVFAVETKGYSKPGDLRGKAGATVSFDGLSLAFPRWSTQAEPEGIDRELSIGWDKVQTQLQEDGITLSKLADKLGLPVFEVENLLFRLTNMQPIEGGETGGSKSRTRLSVV